VARPLSCSLTPASGLEAGSRSLPQLRALVPGCPGRFRGAAGWEALYRDRCVPGPAGTLLSPGRGSSAAAAQPDVQPPPVAAPSAEPAVFTRGGGERERGGPWGSANQRLRGRDEGGGAGNRREEAATEGGLQSRAWLVWPGTGGFGTPKIRMGQPKEKLSPLQTPQ
jgi:hypothetical protein